MKRKEAIRHGDVIKSDYQVSTELGKSEKIEAISVLQSTTRMVEEVISELEYTIKNHGSYTKTFNEGLEYALTLLTEEK